VGVLGGYVEVLVGGVVFLFEMGLFDGMVRVDYKHSLYNYASN